VVSDHIVLVHQQTNKYPYSVTGAIDFDAWTPWHDTLGLIGFVAGKTEQTPPTPVLRLCIIKPTGLPRPSRETNHCFLKLYRFFRRKKANRLNDALV
jgi:hypothetical protein